VHLAALSFFPSLTRAQTGWGTRAGIGDPTQATAAMDNKGASASSEKLSAPAPGLYADGTPHQANPFAGGQPYGGAPDGSDPYGPGAYAR
jgi:hypothetical protein